MSRAVNRVGRYRLIASLGAGSAGRVYAALDDELDRLVALKIVGGGHAIRATGSVEPSAASLRARVVAEARAMARVSHPNLVEVYEVGESQGSFFIAMELVQGQTLSRWLAERPRSLHEIVTTFADAGRGLAAAHASGIIHGDFKPDNVKVEPGGRVKLVDFGLACRPGAFDQNRGVAGTPRFMAPEQFRGDAIDGRADQFAFCVALYHALYREWPFRGETIARIAYAVLTQAAQPPRARHGPHLLARVVLTGLASDRDARHPSMDILLAHLEDLLCHRRSP